MSVVCSSRSSTICKIPSVDRSDQFLAMSRDREKEQCLDAQLHIHEPVKELGFPETNSSLDKKLHYRSLLVVVTQRFFSAIVAFIYRHLCGYLSLRWSVEMVNDGNSTPTVHANCRNTRPRSLSGMVRLCFQLCILKYQNNVEVSKLNDYQVPLQPVPLWLLRITYCRFF